MSLYGGQERRQYERYDCKFGVSFKRKEAPEDFDYSHTKNISLGGILLVASENYQKGTLLELILRIPYTPPTLNIEGEVVWTKQIPNSMVYEMGIRFSQSDQILSQFIQERMH